MTQIIPINVDRNVTPKDYLAHAAAGRLLVTSYFYTFQGEGPYGGEPALFVRLAGCNIGAKKDCPWCDTAFQVDKGTPMSADELLHVIDSLHHKCRLIVVTGGEPLLQWDTLVPMMEYINRRYAGLVWQFETNGLLLRPTMRDAWLHNNVHMVMSPKIPHNWSDYRAVPDWLLHLGPLATSFALKYVVTADSDSRYHYIPDDAFRAQAQGVRVYVSGMAVYKRAPALGELPTVWDATMVDQAATAANYAHAAKLALEHGLRVSYQTHLFGGVE